MFHTYSVRHLQWQAHGDWVLLTVPGPDNRKHPPLLASGDWVPCTVSGPNNRELQRGVGKGICWGGGGECGQDIRKCTGICNDCDTS